VVWSSVIVHDTTLGTVFSKVFGEDGGDESIRDRGR